MSKSRLEDLYKEEISQQLFKELGLKNVMQTPAISKVVLNVGIKTSNSDSKAVQAVIDVMTRVAGQQPVKTLAKKSIAGFKLREGMPIGAKVTLRGRGMYEFLDKLINVALPKVRDFQGVSRKFDRRGNYNLGVKEWMIFPEVSHEMADKVGGLNVTIQTTATTDEQAYELLKKFGMPFRKA